jgi:hypothetical protein
MRLGRLAPVACLVFALPGSVIAEEAPPAAAAEDAAPSAVAGEAAPGAAAEEAEVAPAAELLGPLGHDAEGRAGRIHVVVNGDTLWDISDAYLGTPWVWPSIWKDNTAEVENPHRIYPGERIWISPHEMRKVSADEAAQMLARQAPAEEPMPAAMADPDGPAYAHPQETYRYSDIETTGFVTSEELEGAATIVEVAHARVMLSDGVEVIVGLGRGEVAVGDQLDIFRPGELVRDPETSRVLGHLTMQLGWMEITEVHEESATGVIRLSRREMYRGDHVMPRRVRNIDIAVGSRANVEGAIAHTPDSRRQMGSGDVVYLNRGTRQGLSVGSPLEVYESLGERWDAIRKEKRALPDQVLAKLLVVDAYDDASVAVVTYTTGEINRGFKVRGSDSIRP